MKNKKKWILGAVLLALVIVLVINRDLIWTLYCNLFPAKLTLEETEWTGGASYERVAYADESESQYLDLYVPDGDSPAPLFILIHGGGFVSNDSQSRQAVLMYRYFRDHGFACASINYRLAGEAAYPAAVNDVVAAIGYLGAHAEDYGYDASRAAVWGESAGGYLAARVATMDLDVPIAALVDYYGIMDFGSAEAQFQAQGIPRFVRTIANRWVSDACEGYASCEEYWLRKAFADWTEDEQFELSVVRQAEIAANPRLQTLICHGDVDITVPYAQSVQLGEALSRRYGPENVTVRLLHGLGHAVDAFYTDAQLSTVEAFLRDALG